MLWALSFPPVRHRSIVLPRSLRSHIYKLRCCALCNSSQTVEPRALPILIGSDFYPADRTKECSNCCCLFRSWNPSIITSCRCYFQALGARLLGSLEGNIISQLETRKHFFAGHPRDILPACKSFGTGISVLIRDPSVRT